MEYPSFVTNTLSTFNLLKDINLMIESLTLVGMVTKEPTISAYPYRCFVNTMVNPVLDELENFVHLTQLPINDTMKELMSAIDEYKAAAEDYLDYYNTHTSSYFDERTMVNVSCLWYEKYEPECRGELMEIISNMEEIIKKLYPDREFPEDGYDRIYYKIIPLEE